MVRGVVRGVWYVKNSKYMPCLCYIFSCVASRYLFSVYLFISTFNLNIADIFQILFEFFICEFGTDFKTDHH